MKKGSVQQKKTFYPISNQFREYLTYYNRSAELPVHYENLLQSVDSYPLMNAKNEDTLWQTMVYDQHYGREIFEGLKQIYVLIRSGGDVNILPNLYVDRVDYCTFGNTRPFRIRIVNQYNDNHDYFYVKKADASRVYGLELEHMLSPYNLNFLVYKDTLIEEHIAGIPGDTFIKEFLPTCTDSEKAQIAKEYVKFNERSMIRLLGDMRAYNYVVVPTHDFDQVVYKIRPIDFDQQSFEGKLSVYRPQFFKENIPIMDLVRSRLTHNSINQYKIEERSIVARRIISSGNRLNKLLTIMEQDVITSDSNLKRLRKEIYKFTKDKAFLESQSMGEVMRAALNYVRFTYEKVNMHDLF